MQFELVAPTNIPTQIEGATMAIRVPTSSTRVPIATIAAASFNPPVTVDEIPNRSGSRHSCCASTSRTSLTQALSNGNSIVLTSDRPVYWFADCTFTATALAPPMRVHVSVVVEYKAC